MKFTYKKVSPTVIRPIIPIIIHHHKQQIRYEALVDSGADMCVFPAEIGELIGIDIKNGREESFVGVTGRAEKIYYHEVYLEISGYKTQISVGFTFVKSFDYGFLGQMGLFNYYKVLFHYRKAILELMPDPNVH